MKTWEAFKHIGENIGHKVETKVSDSTITMWYTNSAWFRCTQQRKGESVEVEFLSSNLKLDYEWEVVQTPVTFMEVLRAVGKPIKYAEWGEYMWLDDALKHLTANYATKQIREMMQAKAWYIKED